MTSRPSDRCLAALTALTLSCASSTPPPAQRGSTPVGDEPPTIQPPTGIVEELPAALARVDPPEFSPRHAVIPPPPISGGTLLVLRDDHTAVASDPDHDTVWIADLRSPLRGRPIALTRGDEPGRVLEDDAGQVHVVLRRGGAVVTIDPATASVTAKRSVCPAPRGIAWSDSARLLYVACAGGEFVTMPAVGEPLRRQRLATDLRDVVVNARGLFVTRFRAASVLRVSDDGATEVSSPPTIAQPGGTTRFPAVAWRTVAAGDELLMLHQSTPDVIPSLVTTGGSSGYYGNASIRLTLPRIPTITRVSALATVGDTWTGGIPMLEAGFAVDVAVHVGNGGRRDLAVASPGWAYGQGVEQVHTYGLGPGAMTSGGASVIERHAIQLRDQVVAVAWTRAGALVMQTRAQGSLAVVDDPAHPVVRTIALYNNADVEVGDVGHDVFHAATPAGIACASCHPEGGDDGRVWRFSNLGLRRTPALRGGISDTAPFHWDGDLADLSQLMDQIFTARMGGPSLLPFAKIGVAEWLDTVPAMPIAAPTDFAAVSRGDALFHSPEAGCASCHAGPSYTNNLSVDVGTGGRFQVPPLRGLGLQASYLHDGRAATLRERFTDPACGADAHGHTSSFAPAQIDDMVAFLESL